MNEYRLKKFDGSIYVCGFMATGKSTIGKMLAKELERPFVDLDKIISEKERSSIKAIFERFGEPYFREKEWQYLLEITRTFKGVVALGGGALHNQQVIDHLKVHGLLIFLNTPLDVVVERVLRNTKRPIALNSSGKIKSKETLFRELKALYLSRKELYEQAHIKIESTGYETKEAQTQLLIEKLKRYV
ncbi:MAG: shikimate kinase [Balneolaceae bacterium]